MISMHYQNVIGNTCQTNPTLCQTVGSFFSKNFQWIKNQINSNPNDTYWYQVKLIVLQFQGLYYGYNGITTVDQTKDILDLIIQNPQPYLSLL